MTADVTVPVGSVLIIQPGTTVYGDPGVQLVVNGRNLSQSVRAQHDEGFDPVDAERIEPQFSGSPAFQEGAEFVNDAEGNREWTVPLILTAADRAALHQLVVDIENDLVSGAQVEFASSSNDPSTFFDLERGKLEVEYQYFLSVHATTRATLKLWTRPHGYTGTAAVEDITLRVSADAEGSDAVIAAVAFARALSAATAVG